MEKKIKHGGTKHIDGPIVYSGSVDELNKLCRLKDDYIDELLEEIKELKERIVYMREDIDRLECDAEWNEHSK